MIVMFYPLEITPQIGSNFWGIKRCNIKLEMGEIEGY